MLGSYRVATQLVGCLVVLSSIKLFGYDMLELRTMDDVHNPSNSDFQVCLHNNGAHRSIVVKALCYTPEGPGFETR
jgi:hypothetical protein